MNDEYYGSLVWGGIPEEVIVYLEVLRPINGMKFKIGDLEKKLAGMTDKLLAQRIIEWGRNKGIIEVDSVNMVYYIDIRLVYDDVETHPEYFGIDDNE